MKSLDTASENNAADKDVPAADLKISVHLAKKSMQEGGGLAALNNAIENTTDPAQVISKFLVQLLMSIKDSLTKQNIELSPEIVLADGGWVVQMVDFIEKELKLPPAFSDETIVDVLETFKAMAQGEAKQEAAASQPQTPQGMPMPPQGMPMQGMPMTPQGMPPQGMPQQGA